MKIGQISQCTKILDFKPRVHWPESLPAVAVGEFLVAGFDREPSKPCLFLDDSLEIALAQLYPQIGFIEIARLSSLVDSAFSWSTFCSALNMRYTDDWPRLFSMLAKTPALVMSWFEARSVAARDLAPLKSFNGDSEFRRWCDLALAVVAFQPSKNDGIQVLEWLVDLVLMGKDLYIGGTFADAREVIRAARYPRAADMRQANQTLLNVLPWPAKAKTAVVRNGDRDGFEIKLFVTSKDELQKQIASLQNVEGQWPI